MEQLYSLYGNLLSQSQSSGVQSIERVLDIIEALGKHADGIGIARLCDLTGLQKSTVHRLLATLRQRHYVVQNNHGQYRLSFKLCQLSREFINGFSMVGMAAPILKNLCSQSRETAQLVMREGDGTIYLHREEFHDAAIRVVSNIGMHRLLHTTAVGKSILSRMTDPEIDQYWDRVDKPQVTINTVRDLDRLRGDIDTCRRTGFATDFEENTYGVHCIAMALPSVSLDQALAVSIAGPKDRMTEIQMASFIPYLHETIHHLEAQLMG